jgi:hypothetical protein
MCSESVSDEALGAMAKVWPRKLRLGMVSCVLKCHRGCAAFQVRRRVSCLECLSFNLDDSGASDRESSFCRLRLYPCRLSIFPSSPPAPLASLPPALLGVCPSSPSLPSLTPPPSLSREQEHRPESRLHKLSPHLQRSLLVPAPAAAEASISPVKRNLFPLPQTLPCML